MTRLISFALSMGCLCALCWMATEAQPLQVAASPPARQGHPLSLFGQPAGKIFGSVLDPNEARIPKARVIVENDQSKYKTLTNDSGEYEIDVPPGIYRITTEVVGYYPSRRAQVGVDSNSKIMINIAPALEILSIGLTVTAEGASELVTKAPPPKYESYLLPQSSGAPQDLLIQYREKSEDESFIQYKRAQVSHGTLTVYADEVRFNRSKSTVEASGGYLVVEDGRRRIQARKIQIDFNLENPIVTLEEEKKK